MESRRGYVVIFFLIIFFLLNWDFLWDHFVTQNVMMNLFLPIHPFKTSDWRFAWQNGYGRRPLTSESFIVDHEAQISSTGNIKLLLIYPLFSVLTSLMDM